MLVFLIKKIGITKYMLEDILVVNNMTTLVPVDRETEKHKETVKT